MKPPLRMETIAHYSHEPETIWALIRPAEAAVLLGHSQRAFHVPGTLVGVGEQQCFIDSDGRELIIEVVSERTGRSATTRIISPPNLPIESTYELRVTEAGCDLVYGMESRAAGRFSRKQREVWEKGAQEFLNAIDSVLSEGHPKDRNTPAA